MLAYSPLRIIATWTMLGIASFGLSSCKGCGKSEREKAAEWDRFIDFIKKEKWDR